jgi:GrpB-like predicted nucleotidyltransferase (UPF0157 family)
MIALDHAEASARGPSSQDPPRSPTMMSVTYDEKPTATVEVVAYDGTWAEMFDVERDLLAAVIPEARAIEHIGSTSIPGLAAKPTIDILAVVDEISDVLDRRSVLAELGYEYRPGSFADDDEHLFFRKVSGRRRTHHLHVLASSSPKPESYRLFRDYLITNGDAANRYEEAKRALALQYANERARYIDKKVDVVSELLSEAFRWRSKS